MSVKGVPGDCSDRRQHGCVIDPRHDLPLNYGHQGQGLAANGRFARHSKTSTIIVFMNTFNYTL